MLKHYPTFKMPVYPSRRTALFPQKHYEQTRDCAQKAKLAADNNGVTGCTGGVPFPVPKNGYEVMWNHNLRYWGDTFETQFVHIAPTRAGDYTATEFEFQADFHYGNLTLPASEVIPNRRVNYMQTVTGPARLAGEVILIHENVDFSKEARAVWIYNPGQRRVRLAPTVAYDNPIVGSDGQRTVDDGFMFNGSLDRYEWKLIGKKEMFIPANSYRLHANTVKYADLLKKGHANPDFLRYELRRVWVLEGSLKENYRHAFGKRVMFIDEDNWQASVGDYYDTRGALWQHAFINHYYAFDLNAWQAGTSFYHDLNSGAYLANSLLQEREKGPILNKEGLLSPDMFTPTALRAIGQ